MADRPPSTFTLWLDEALSGWILPVAALGAVAVQGAGLGAAAAATSLVAALAGFGVGGAAHGLKNVLLRTLIHRRVPDSLRGRAFAAYNATRNAAELGALVAGGVLVAAIGARAALALSGVVPLGIALIAVLLMKSATTVTIRRRTTYAHVES
jgi:sugar phosphate permease